MKLTEKLIKKFEMHYDTFLSGEELAAEFGVSRNAVWKAVNTLKADGFSIESTALGYIMDRKDPRPTAFSIEKYIWYKDFFRIEVVDELSSTNTVIKDAATHGEAEGKVIVALSQTEGRGRQDRAFFSPKGCGIYFSLLLRPKLEIDECGNFTAMSGVAVARAIEDVTGEEVGIKWVNDVIMNGKKVCGILTEAEVDIENYAYKYVAIGIGINLSTPKDGYGALESVATSVFENGKCSIDTISKIVASVLNRLYESYIKLPNKDFIAQYSARQVLVGENVELLRNDVVYNRGKVIGVDRRCALLVETEQGDTYSIDCGEALVKARL